MQQSPLYPVSGSGLYQLSRPEYKALGFFNTHGQAKGLEYLTSAKYNQDVIKRGLEVWKIVK